MAARLLYFVISFCAVAIAQCELIDFEDAASFGGDETPITSAYLQSYGVSIAASIGRNARRAENAQLTFEGSGADGTDAFWIDTGATNALNALGDFFLKIGAGDFPYDRARYFSMTIDYNAPVIGASGEIWDIDGSEQFQVVGFDANGNQVASVDSPNGGLDGLPWTWALNVVGADTISTVEINKIGNGRIRGIAFDNFNSTSHSVPIPAAFPLGCIGLLGLIVSRRNRGSRTGTPSHP